MSSVQLYIPKAKRVAGGAAASPALQPDPANNDAPAGPAHPHSVEDAAASHQRPAAEKENLDPQPLPTGMKAQAAQAPKSGKHSVQLFLDLGQRDFNASKCPDCGMVYARGQEEDEKLHRLYHANAMQGIKFPGWSRERVLPLGDANQGRMLMVLPTDPAAQVKKVQEICACIEQMHGMASGWLLGTPNWKVFLHVSAQRKVVGLAVIEGVKHAFRLADEQGEEVESQPHRHSSAADQPSSSRQRPAEPSSTGRGQEGSSSGAAAAMRRERQQQPHEAAAGGAQGAASTSQAAARSSAGLFKVGRTIHSAPAAPSSDRHSTGAASGAAGASSAQAPAASVPVGAGSGAGGSGAGGSGWLARRVGSKRPGGRGAQLLADKSKAYRAHAGVRMVWVSADHQRQGLATKLLDAARCHMILGYVIARQQMAFSQPTEAGVRFAAAYTATQRFLVYGV